MIDDQLLANQSPDSPQSQEHRIEAPVSLRTLALVFLKLGTIAFGGPAAHIAMMEDEFVGRKRWLTREQFVDRLAAANLIPGPSSTEMALFVGFEKRGWLGLLAAGCSFILPAAIIVGTIAGAYVRYGALPQVDGVLYALKPVVIAVVVQAFWKLTTTALKTKWLAVVGLAAATFYALHLQEILVLVISAVLALAPRLTRNVVRLRCIAPALVVREVAQVAQSVPVRMLSLFGSSASLSSVPGMGRLFFIFAKIGSMLFGSGYVLLAFLRSDFVDRLHWLTEKQLLDAVAVGQITPGPVFTTATFIGYLIGGTRGAVAATAGIFAPAFVFVAVSGKLLPKIRQSRTAGTMLDGVAVGSLALMGVVAWQLGKAAIVDVPTMAIAVLSALLLLRFRLNSAWLIALAAVFGWFYRR